MPEGAVAVRVVVRGAVQGTGFRPFVYRLARGLGLTGSIRNTPFGVVIHAEGGAVEISGKGGLVLTGNVKAATLPSAAPAQPSA